jgi:hypothetical protein
MDLTLSSSLPSWSRSLRPSQSLLDAYEKIASINEKNSSFPRHSFIFLLSLRPTPTILHAVNYQLPTINPLSSFCFWSLAAGYCPQGGIWGRLNFTEIIAKPEPG